MILNDKQIIELAENGMIEPFEPKQVKKRLRDTRVISYGTSSFGYDIRLGVDFRIFHHIPGNIIDPKDFDDQFLEPSKINIHYSDYDDSEYVILPAHTYGLGVSIERFNIPRNILAIAVGKSTYARCGIFVNVTPAEPDWRGYLTLEFYNAASSDCKLYIGEGCLQLLFLQGENCLTSYNDKHGKYQNQLNFVQPAIV
ncbi:MAG: dCTP deaminase [Desertifilum sp.]|nr:dCTP deaminase [Desertifilum sp.]